MSAPRWRCPTCGMERSNAIQLNHVHDGKVVPWTHVGGPAPLDVSGRFVIDGQPESTQGRRTRTRKAQ